MFLENIETFKDNVEILKSQNKRNCNICNGEGIVKGDLGYKTCECVKKANIQARLISNGLPRRFLNYNWNKNENFKNDIATFEKIRDYCNNIDSNSNGYNNLFLHCSNINKIMELESIMSNDLAYKRNFNGFFNNILIVSVDDFVQTAYYGKSNNETRAKLQKVINGIDILILNGLGEEVELRNDFTTKYLNNILTNRIFNGKLNIISSSLSMDQIINKYDMNMVNVIKNNFKLIKINDEMNKNENKNEYGGESNGYY